MVFVSRRKKLLIALRALLRRRLQCESRCCWSNYFRKIKGIGIPQVLGTSAYVPKTCMEFFWSWRGFRYIWGSPPHLSDIEFRKKYRLSRTTSVDYLGSLKIIQCSHKNPVVVGEWVLCRLSSWRSLPVWGVLIQVDTSQEVNFQQGVEHIINTAIELLKQLAA